MPETLAALHDRWFRAAYPITGGKVPSPSPRGAAGGGQAAPSGGHFLHPFPGFTAPPFRRRGQIYHWFHATGKLPPRRGPHDGQNGYSRTSGSRSGQFGGSILPTTSPFWFTTRIVRRKLCHGDVGSEFGEAQSIRTTLPSGDGSNWTDPLIFSSRTTGFFPSSRINSTRNW